VPALAKHATRKHLKPADAAKIIELVQLRQRFGSYPQATLHELDEIVDRAESWRAKASEALMAERPTTEEAAEGIVMTIRRKHVADLYEQFGELPDLESDPIILDWLEDVPEQNREELMRRLLAEFAPITLEKVRAILLAG
jgi:hypothetical protein